MSNNPCGVARETVPTFLTLADMKRFQCVVYKCLLFCIFLSQFQKMVARRTSSGILGKRARKYLEKHPEIKLNHEAFQNLSVTMRKHK
jgi:hypothetical protein